MYVTITDGSTRDGGTFQGRLVFRRGHRVQAGADRDRLLRFAGHAGERGKRCMSV